MTTANEMLIEYPFLDLAGVEQVGSWRGSAERAIEMAAYVLDAKREGNHWRYLGDESTGFWAVLATDDQMAELGAAILAGHPWSRVYRLWCTRYGCPT